MRVSRVRSRSRAAEASDLYLTFKHAKARRSRPASSRAAGLTNLNGVRIPGGRNHQSSSSRSRLCELEGPALHPPGQGKSACSEFVVSDSSNTVHFVARNDLMEFLTQSNLFNFIAGCGEVWRRAFSARRWLDFQVAISSARSRSPF